VAQADTGEYPSLLETSGDFEVVVSDLRMPGMINGLDVLSFSKSNRSAHRLDSNTAFGSDQIRDQTRQLGPSYMEKPITLNSLLQEIKNILAVKPEISCRSTQMLKMSRWSQRH
jgi:DNA-binding NtrC family response regulator